MGLNRKILSKANCLSTRQFSIYSKKFLPKLPPKNIKPKLPKKDPNIPLIILRKSGEYKKYTFLEYRIMRRWRMDEYSPDSPMNEFLISYWRDEHSIWWQDDEIKPYTSSKEYMLRYREYRSKPYAALEAEIKKWRDNEIKPYSPLDIESWLRREHKQYEDRRKHHGLPSLIPYPVLHKIRLVKDIAKMVLKGEDYKEFDGKVDHIINNDMTYYEIKEFILNKKKYSFTFKLLLLCTNIPWDGETSSIQYANLILIFIKKLVQIFYK